MTEITVADVTSTIERISVYIKGKEIFFDVPRWVNPSCDFAIWVSLPIAMRYGGRLQINGATSEIARRKAQELSLIWSTWLPKTFKPVTVTSKGYLNPNPARDDRTIMLFSGGVDSTFALKRHVEEGGEKPDLLTIHGMDYRRNDLGRFEGLLHKTAKFRERYSNDSFQVRSNAASIMRRFGISEAYGHGFQLFATLFLFDNTHSKGLIAADFTKLQDHIVSPWGTNSYTNDFFEGDRMKIVTVSNDVTRGNKLEVLARDELALKALSFCKNYSARPENCGICSKCVRTKAMFHASSAGVPDIFHISPFRIEDLRFLDFSKRVEIAFCLDLLGIAEKSGLEHDFDFLKERLYSKRKSSSLSGILRKIESKVRTFFGRP